MATIKRFEDIESWQMARAFCKWLFNIIETTELKQDYALRNQIDRSSGSVMDNIAEGFERSGTREFVQFLSTAKASAGETRSQLYRVFDRSYIDEQLFLAKKEELEQISSKINGFMNYLINSEHKGWKFKEPDTEYGNSDVNEA